MVEKLYHGNLAGTQEREYYIGDGDIEVAGSPIIGLRTTSDGFLEYREAGPGTPWRRLGAINTVAKEPTGFSEPENIVQTYNPTTRTITLTGTVEAYWRGAVITALVSGWESDPHPAAPTQSQFLYYNGTAFVWSTSPWLFSDLPIAFVAFSGAGTYLFTLREVHGTMPWQSHMDFHENIGTWRSAGGDVTGFVLQSTTPIDRRPLISECTINDEDIPTVLQAHTTQNNYTTAHLDGAGGALVLTTGVADIPWIVGGAVVWNEFVGGAWTDTELANNKYMSLWLMAIPAAEDTTGNQSQNARFIWWAGQAESTLLAGEQARSPAELNLGEFANTATEFVFIEQVIIRETGANDFEIIEQRRLTGNKFSTISGGSGGITDHGALTGLADDDHTQYLLISGLRAMTGNLDLGNNLMVNTEAIQFNTTPGALTHVEGQAHWDDDAKTLELDTEIEGVHIQVGQEVVIRCQNNSGVEIPNGAVVYIDGALSQRPTAAMVQANSVNACKTIGMATNTAADQAYVYVTVTGLVRGIDTDGLTEGEFVFLSDTVLGGLRQTQPDAPNISVRIGVVAYAHATEGKVLVNPFLLAQLAKLSDVSARGNQTDGQILAWNAATSSWDAIDPSATSFDPDTILTDDVTGQVLVDDVTGNVLVTP